LDAWAQQLAQIHNVSETVAASITKEYPTVRSLINMYYSNGLTEKEKRLLLADIKVQNLNGTSTRRVGPSISEKIYRIFTETDGTKVVH